jgi:serine/threonine-protein kinase HipA
MQTLRIFLYEELIGTVTHLPGDKNLFVFESGYIENEMRPTLSLNFETPQNKLKTNIPLTQTRLPPFFSNLLPEGPLREYLAERGGLNPEHEFFLLASLGEDLAGAVRVETAGELKFPLDAVKRTRKRESQFHFSLAGVQLKFSAVHKGKRWVIPKNGVGGEWIVKLPHAIFPGIPENEYSMMELARRVGIDVPKTALYPLKDLEELPKEFQHLDHKVFAIQRFDREEGKKIHIEDFAQVFGVYPEKKYKSASYRNIVEVIQNEVGEKSVAEFIRRFVFNALIGNGDMHLKNWSLIYLDRRKGTLAPAYDFVSTIPYIPEDQLALNFVDSREFSSLTLDQFKRFAYKGKISEKLVMETVEQTVDAFHKAWKTVHDLPVTKEVVSVISNHLKTLPFLV